MQFLATTEYLLILSFRLNSDGRWSFINNSLVFVLPSAPFKTWVFLEDVFSSLLDIYILFLNNLVMHFQL